MKYKNLLLVLIGITVLIFPVYAADSGTLTIESQAVHAYSTSGLTSGAASIDFNNFRIDATDYDILYSFDLNLSGIQNFPAESSSTTFTCTSGCTGSGTVSYTKSTGKVYWLTGANSITISNSNITFSYGAPIFDGFTDVNVLVRNDLETVSSTQPIKIESTGGSIMSKNPTNGRVFDYDSFTALRVSNSYSVTYSTNVLGQIVFNTSVDKSGTSVPTRITLKNQTNVNYSTESTLTTTSFTILNTLTTGIYIRAETQSGSFTEATINTTGLTGQPSPTNTPVINNNTGKGISFDHNTYTIGDTANISWTISDGVWNSLSTQTVVLKKVGIDDTTSISNVAPKTGSSLWLWTSCANPATQSVLCGYGTYQAIIYTNLLGILETNRETAEAQVYPAQDSYILINSSVPIKTPVNVTAFIGVGGVGSNGMLATYFFDVNSNDYIGESQVVGLQSGTNYRNLTFKQIGKYRVVLKNIVTNQEYAAKIIDTYHTQISAPYNFTTSNITLNKVSFTFNDVMIGNYKVDSVNYSTGYPTYIDIYNLDTNSITAEFYGTGQTWDDTSKQLGDVFIRIENLPAISGFPETKWIPGNNLIRLMLNNSDAGNSTVLSFVQFTLSSINSDGYGLTVNKNKILSGETVTVSATLPPATTANLTLIDPNGKVTSRKLSTSISFTDKLKTVGQYQYQLMNANNEIEMSVYVEVTAPASSEVPASIPSGNTAVSNAGSNMRTLLSQPFFWGLVILALILYTIRNTRVVKEVSIFVIFVEDVVGLFAPYTIFILIGLIIFAAISLRTGKEVVTGEE